MGSKKQRRQRERKERERCRKAQASAQRKAQILQELPALIDREQHRLLLGNFSKAAALRQIHGIWQLLCVPGFEGAVAMARREMDKEMDYNTYTMALPLELLEQCPGSEDAAAAVRRNQYVVVYLRIRNVRDPLYYAGEHVGDVPFYPREVWATILL